MDIDTDFPFCVFGNTFEHLSELVLIVFLGQFLVFSVEIFYVLGMVVESCWDDFVTISTPKIVVLCVQVVHLVIVSNCVQPDVENIMDHRTIIGGMHDTRVQIDIPF